MENDTHDEPNPWRSFGLQAALIVNRLRCQAQLSKMQNDTNTDHWHREHERKEDGGQPAGDAIASNIG
jgi:hypothetical protein